MIIPRSLSLKKSKLRDILFLTLILLLGLAIRLYKLDSIPAEMWGDVNTQFSQVLKIQNSGFYTTYEAGSDGPFFPHIAYLFSLLFGLSFYTLKLTSVFGGLLLIITTYLYSKELFKNKYIGIISAFFATTSFWALSMSRQAKPHIFIPVFISLALYFALKKKKAIAGILLGIGLYTQTAYWGAVLIFWYQLLILLYSLLTSIPFYFDFISHPDKLLSPSTYLGEKVVLPTISNAPQMIIKIVNNYARNFMGNFINGDPVFRQNISGQASFDLISGLLLILGIVLIFKSIVIKKNKKLLYFLFFPYLLIQLPAVIDIKHPLSTPNIGRTIGILPLLLSVISYALYEITVLIKKRYFKFIFLFTMISSIFIINNYRYFVLYPKGLPNNNVPFGKVIAKYIDTIPISTKTIIINCCWGEWGQPEPLSIIYSLEKTSKRSISFINNFNYCEGDRPLLIITDPNQSQLDESIKNCYQSNNIKTQLLNEKNVPVAKIFRIN